MDQQLQDDAMESFSAPAGRALLAVPSTPIPVNSMAYLIPVSKVTRHTASVNVLGGLPTSRERTPDLSQQEINGTAHSEVPELQRYYMATIRVPSVHSSAGTST
jgi:hypothetical protein